MHDVLCTVHAIECLVHLYLVRKSAEPGFVSFLVCTTVILEVHDVMWYARGIMWVSDKHRWMLCLLIQTVTVA